MNRLEKLRDTLANEYEKQAWRLAPYSEFTIDGSYREGWNACAAEYEKIIKELEGALKISRDKHEGMATCLMNHGANLNIPFLINDCIFSMDICDQSLDKLEEWRGE